MAFMLIIRKYILLFFIIIVASFINGYSQVSNEIFGKNRIQTRTYQWKYYDANQFRIFHYDRSGRELARYVAEQAELDVAALEKRMSGLFPKQINIIVYNSYDDYEQTNIGLSTDLQLKYNNTVGTFDVVGDKIVIYFNGNHNDLKLQLRRGMAKVIMERFVYGENFREIVRNSVLLDLPSWFTEGYIDYLIDGWNTNDDNEWKNLVDRNDNAKFHNISFYYPNIAGKAFWKYIATKYGENSVKNIIYLTKSKSNINQAVSITTGSKIAIVYDSLIAFYKNRYQQESALYAERDTKDLLVSIPSSDYDTKIRSVMVSPRGDQVAYVKWEHGEYKVIIEKTNMEDGKRVPAKIISGGVFNMEGVDDPDYPLIGWSNTGFKLGIIQKVNDRIRIRVYDASRGKILNFNVPKNRFDRITGFTFMEDDDMLILSAIRRGQSDIFEYRMKGGRMTQLTDDAWDDALPVFVSGGSRKGVVFLSNRPEPYLDINTLPNELPIGKMKAYFYNATTKRPELTLISQGFEGAIKNVIPYGMDNFAFLSDKNGVTNRYVVMFAADRNNLDSAYAIPVTNFNRSILFQQYNPASQKIADVVQYNDSLHIFFRPAELPAPWGNLQPVELTPLTFVDNTIEDNALLKQQGKTGEGMLNKTKDKEAFKIEAGNDFQTTFEIIEPSTDEQQRPTNVESDAFALKLDFKDTIIQIPVQEQPTYIDNKRVIYVDSTYIELRSQVYRTTFKPDFLGVRIDNTMLFTKYQPYGGNAGGFDVPRVGALLFASLFDKFEDYRISGGLKLPSGNSGMTYLFGFDNYKRRVDWGVHFFRQRNNREYTFLLNNNELYTTPGKTYTNYLQGNATYAFDKVNSVRMNFGIRRDDMIVSLQDFFGINLPNTQEYWALSRAEYVYDDTKMPIYNIWNGLRMKFFGEYYYKFFSNNDAYEIPGTKLAKTGAMINLGLDIRYYKKVWKETIFAVRLSGAHSMGSHQVKYNLGGMENSLNLNQGSNFIPSTDRNYAFQTQVYNLRGYNLSDRNGNTFLLTNLEWRIPFMNTFFNKPTQSSILQYLQLVAFLDIGNAWEGFFPSEQNAKRVGRYTWPQPPMPPVVNVTINNNWVNSPAIGYGLGVRTKVFGYFIKADVARNIESDYTWYLSIGTDF